MQTTQTPITSASLSARLKSDEPGTDEHPYPDLLPGDNLRDLQFAINFYTAIGLGALALGLRSRLEELGRLAAEQKRRAAARAAAEPARRGSAGSGYSSSGSYYSSSGSYSYSGYYSDAYYSSASGGDGAEAKKQRKD
jgi:pre-mRNA-splicing factor CWC22